MRRKGGRQGSVAGVKAVILDVWSIDTTDVVLVETVVSSTDISIYVVFSAGRRAEKGVSLVVSESIYKVSLKRVDIVTDVLAKATRYV